MDEYIEKEKVLNILCTVSAPTPTESWIVEKCIEKVNEVDAADVAPVRHGRWVEYDCFCCNSDGKPVVKTGVVFVCSVCGREENCKERYCHCGAKMDLED